MSQSDEPEVLFMQAVAYGDAEAAFARFADIVRTRIGTKLLTAQIHDRSQGRSRRIFSDDNASYPVGGYKTLVENKWTEIVLDRHEVFAGLTIEDVAEVFFDWQLIQSLGCESNANIPVVVGEQVLGTVNLLHESGFYTPERLAPAAAILSYATIAFLLMKQADKDNNL
jgi:hypothetical protein